MGPVPDQNWFILPDYFVSFVDVPFYIRIYLFSPDTVDNTKVGVYLESWRSGYRLTI